MKIDWNRTAGPDWNYRNYWFIFSIKSEVSEYNEKEDANIYMYFYIFVEDNMLLENTYLCWSQVCESQQSRVTVFVSLKIP